MIDTLNPVQRISSGHTPVQLDALSDPLGTDHLSGASQVAAQGTSGPSAPLPFLGAIQESFGSHDVSEVKAYSGGKTAQAAKSLGAKAFASGDSVGFGSTPDLHTAAHEAAHTVQQRQGVQLKGEMGQAGDSYERHADAVADKVVAGESAQGLLDQGGSSSGSASGGAVQLIRFGDVDYVTGENTKTKKQWATDALHAIEDFVGFDPEIDRRLVGVLVNQNIHIRDADELWATIHPAHRKYQDKLMNKPEQINKLGKVTQKQELLEASVQYLRGNLGVDDSGVEEPEVQGGDKHARHVNIGRKSNTFDLKGKEAFGVLKASKWTEAVNEAFIEGGIDNENTFIVHAELPEAVIECLRDGDGGTFEAIVRDYGSTMEAPDLSGVEDEDKQAVIDSDPWTALFDTRSGDLTTFAKEVIQILAGGYVLD
jgi:hypothetical protein